MAKIKKLDALEVLDSRGNPTVEVVLETENTVARAIVPSGASTGEHEALELRDGDKKRYNGKGVLKACKNVTDIIAPAVLGMDISSFDAQRELNKKLIELDGTENKSRLGANATLGVTMAALRAFAQEQGKAIYEMRPNAVLLPVPLMNVINGGKHADSGLDIQEFMIVPAGLPSFSEALRAGAEIYHALKGLLADASYATSVGDEGGFAPKLKNHKEAFEFLMKAIKKAGYKAGEEVYLAVDCAASEFFKDEKYTFEGKKHSALEMIEYYESLVKEYPLVSIEDGLAQDDWDNWKILQERLGGKIQLIGDDLLVTNTVRLKKAIEEKACNAILIKINQIGTLTETEDAIEMARSAGFASIISHRSGETEDAFIADIAVASEVGQIKSGAPCRTDRVSKYNQLLRIEKALGDRAEYKNPFKK